MGDALKKRGYYSVAEYEALCQQAREGERYEYVDGQVIPLTDEYTSNAHNLIVGNTAHLLRNHYHPKGYRVYSENARLVMDNVSQHRLPDVMATCSERDKKAVDATYDPLILVEVLSRSTAFADLVDKVASYKTIPALQAYLIINPEKLWVRLIERNPSGEWMADREYTQLADVIIVHQLELTMALATIYQMVF